MTAAFGRQQFEAGRRRPGVLDRFFCGKTGIGAAGGQQEQRAKEGKPGEVHEVAVVGLKYAGI